MNFKYAVVPMHFKLSQLCLINDKIDTNPLVPVSLYSVVVPILFEQWNLIHNIPDLIILHCSTVMLLKFLEVGYASV